MDRINLTDAQHTAAMALLWQQQQILNEANRSLQQIQDALRELAGLIVANAGVSGPDEYEFAQDGARLYLQRRTRGIDDNPTDSGQDGPADS